ncbi:MAG: hypothetical protein FWD42_10435, partial [Solirubrobacterales bacterium]|nr:hypothetical protein [Solirubrobacterales bacterium]
DNDNDPTARSQISIDAELTEEIHDVWRSACREAEAAYRSWSAATGEASADAYVVYAAQLDQEEAAARHLRSSIEAPGAQAETAPRAPVRPAGGGGGGGSGGGSGGGGGGGERSEAIRAAICVAPLSERRWARLFTIAARPPHGGAKPARPRRRPDEPPRAQEST